MSTLLLWSSLQPLVYLTLFQKGDHPIVDISSCCIPDSLPISFPACWPSSIFQDSLLILSLPYCYYSATTTAF